MFMSRITVLQQDLAKEQLLHNSQTHWQWLDTTNTVLLQHTTGDCVSKCATMLLQTKAESVAFQQLAMYISTLPAAHTITTRFRPDQIWSPDVV
jgi:hypothetical protein